jgi:hypothetical protein
VELLNGELRGLVIGDFDEPEAARLPSHAIDDHFNPDWLHAHVLKGSTERVLGRMKREVPNVQTLAHRTDSSAARIRTNNPLGRASRAPVRR